MALEIERKFLLSDYPEHQITEGLLEVLSVQEIDQTYLALAEGEELRVRRLTDPHTDESEYTLTYKNGHGLVRQEIEQSITQQLYEELMDKVRLKPLIKERTTARLSKSGTIVEIDRYIHTALVVVEVEFADEGEAERFASPDWFGADISTNKTYSNKEMWKQLNR